MNPARARYDALVAPACARLRTDRRLAALLDPELPPTRLQLYLMQLSGWRVQLNEPLRRSLRRAGERCLAGGHPEVGQALIARARADADRELVWRCELRALVAAWNDAGRPPVTQSQFIDAAATPAMKRHIDLCDRLVASGEPQARAAIGHEIARLQARFAPALLACCAEALGPAAAGALGSLQEQADAGADAEDPLAALLDSQPELAPRLGQIAAAALTSYLDFLGDCLDAVADPIVGTVIARPRAAASLAEAV